MSHACYRKRKLNLVVAAFSLEWSLFRGLSRFTFVAQVESVERPDFALGAPDPENIREKKKKVLRL